MVIKEGTQAITVLAICQFEMKKNIWQFETHAHMVLEMSKCYSCGFHLIFLLWWNTGFINFLGNEASFENFVALWNFDMEVNGKSLNVEYLETTDRRVNRMKL